MDFTFQSRWIAKCRDFIAAERTRFLTACISVFILGLIAHAYGFLNLTISHDSLAQFYLLKEEIIVRLRVGRFIVPVYQLIFHGWIALPWINGLLALCWLSISVWMTAYMFSIKKKLQIALIAGIFSVNVSVTAFAATYIHDFDGDMFAVMLAVSMALLWQRGGKAVWFGIPLIVIALGLYQSVVSVAIALVMFSSIMALLQGEKTGGVIRKGLQAAGIILSAGIIYLLIVKISCYWANLTISSDYNSLNKIYDRSWGGRQCLALFGKVYLEWYLVLFRCARPLAFIQLLHLLVALPALVVIFYAMRKKSLALSNKILTLVLMVLLPLGMNVSQLLADGLIHDLMLYAALLIYLLVILLVNWFAESAERKELPRICRAVVGVALILILAINVQTANIAHLKKDMEFQGALAYMGAVNADMTKLPDYVPGKTEVAFIGHPPTGFEDGFRNVVRITGLWYHTPMTYSYDPYFRFVLQTPLKEYSEPIPQEFADAMSVYPKEGCMQWYGNVLVVKLSEK